MFDRETNNRRTQSIGLALILAISVFFWGNSLLFGIANVITYLSAPVIYTNRQVAEATGQALLASRSKDSLIQENLILRRRINYLNSLWPVAGSADSTSLGLKVKTASVRVLSRPNQQPYDYLLVEAGDENTAGKIKPGQLVTYGDVALGRVVTVYQTISKVKLFSSSGTKLPVTIGSTSPATLAEGVAGGNFVITLPRGLEIVRGERVRLSNLAVGFYLGSVGFVEKSPASPFQKVYFRFPTNLYELTTVTIHYD